MARPDFGVSRVEHEGVVLECAFIAPGLTFQNLQNAYHEAEKECSPGDSFAGDPSKWPGSRGVLAVAEMILTAIYGPDDDADGSKQK